MSKTYLSYDPTQAFLLPPSPLEWLPEGHLARFVMDTVAALDLSPIYAHYDRELRGKPPYHPQMMVGLLVYGYCLGVSSSRKIEKRTHEDVAFRVIAGNRQPNHVQISEFRRIHLATLSGLFLQVLQMCQKMKMAKLGHVSLDGTKMKANASKHKAMSQERMVSDEARLAAEVAALLKAAEETDAAEDALHGKGVRGDEIPSELRRRETRLARIREVKAELLAEAKEQAAARAAQATIEAQTKAALVEMNNVRAARKNDNSDDEPPPPTSTSRPERLPEHQVPTNEDGTPTNKAQRNFTDAESRIMKTNAGFEQGYNAQAVVDEANQIIVAVGVTNQSPDAEHFIPMLDRTVENLGAAPERVSADTGYFSEANVRRGEARGMDLYIATGRTKHNSHAVGSAADDGQRTVKSQMKIKLASDEGKAIYARRKVIVEPVFGQIKNRGFRHFLLRGLEKVRAEWSLIAMSHNLLKLFGFQSSRGWVAA
ncbi:MAG: IS1182 family transposase [Deltaproteobacteria bacterium]